MNGHVEAVQQLESKPVGSPVRVKADPLLVSDVASPTPTPTPTQPDFSEKKYLESKVAWDSVVADIPTDDEDGEVFDKTVASFLIGMNMDQYLHLFKDADIGFNLFLTLTEDDLEVIGINDKSHRTDIAHSIANIRKMRGGPSHGRTRGLSDDVADATVSFEEALPIMCHTLKHINNLVLLLRNYRSRLSSKNKVHNRMMDYQHSAAYGAKILTKEAIAQSELLKIQLHGMLLKIDPVMSGKSSLRKNTVGSSKESKNFTNGVFGGILVTAVGISLMLSIMPIFLRRRLA